MKKLIITMILFGGTVLSLSSQTASDALRYSRIFYGGTARFLSTGGAFGAVGANFSSLATNPAGLGLYRSSEISITPGFFGNFTRSDYQGSAFNEFKANFALGNIGYVYTFNPGRVNQSGGLRSFSIGFGMNRQNDFNQRIFIAGPNHTSSLLNVFTNELNTPPVISPNEVRYAYEFDAGLAYDCGLLFYDSTLNKYFSDMPGGGAYQQQLINTWGSVNEFDIAFGGNIADRLYFGLTIGIPSVRYFYQSIYEEMDNGDSIPYFQSLRYDYNYETHGTGMNFKAGLIYRPADWVRLGAAIHSPTWYPNMYDNYEASMSAIYDSVLYYPVQYSPIGLYEYQMITPFRTIASVAFFIGKHGFISGEYEYVNYNQARFRAPGDDFRDVNDVISGSYKAPLNLRFGTEWRVSQFRFRGGFGYYGSPDGNAAYGNRITASGGFGFQVQMFYMDFAYQWSKSTEQTYLYDPAISNPADLSTYTHTAFTTIGFRF